MVTAAVPATATAARKLTLKYASSVRRLALVQEKGDITVIVTAPAPVVIFRSPAASMLVRSLTFSTAFLSVGEHTPLEQVMFLVAAVEISTDACAAPAP